MRKIGMLLVACALFGMEGLDAMEANLNVPYSPQCSPPQKPELAFFSKQSDDMLFQSGAAVDICCQSGTRALSLHWVLSRNRFAKPFATGWAEAGVANNFVMHLPTEKLFPGFFDVTVMLNNGGLAEIKSVCTFGWKVSQMAVRDTRPADFKVFWERGKQALASIPLDAKTGDVLHFRDKEIDAYNVAHAALPGNFDPDGVRCSEVEAFKVDFASVDGLRVHGWLAKPVGPGPFPVMLILPGGGFASRPIPLEHARHGFMALDIQIHGQAVDLEKYERLPGYYDNFVYEPLDKYYYHAVYLHCVQAINYLLSRPDADPTSVVAVGGSQGGRLSIVIAALDPRVKAIVPAITHAGNLPYTAWAEDVNKYHPDDDGMGSVLPPFAATPENRCLPYYDVLNFAPDVTCPVLMNAGLIDPVSPPSCVFAIFQRLGSVDKTLLPLPGLGHDWSAEFDRRAWRWLDQHLNLPSR